MSPHYNLSPSVKIYRRHLRIRSSSQARLYVGVGGNCPQTWVLPTPNTVRRTQISAYDIGAKRSVRWPSKYAKMRFRPDPAGGAHDAPQGPKSAGEGTTSPYRTTPRFARHMALTTRRLHRLSSWGALLQKCPLLQYFPLEPPLQAAPARKSY